MAVTAFLKVNRPMDLLSYIRDKDNHPYPVKVNGKYGYSNKTGRIVIKPQFDWAC